MRNIMKCPRHKTYKVVRKPKSDCFVCLQMWRESLEDKAMKLRREASQLEESVIKDCTGVFMQGNIGKCFVYRNCYSCPGPNDYWNLYRKILDVVDGNYIIETFQKDIHGKFEVDKTSLCSFTLLGIPITMNEYKKAKRTFLTDMKKVLRG